VEGGVREHGQDVEEEAWRVRLLHRLGGSAQLEGGKGWSGGEESGRRWTSPTTVAPDAAAAIVVYVLPRPLPADLLVRMVLVLALMRRMLLLLMLLLLMMLLLLLMMLLLLLLHRPVVLARYLHVSGRRSGLEGLEGRMLVVERVGRRRRQDARPEDAVVGRISLESHLGTHPGVVHLADVGGGTCRPELDDIVGVADLGAGEAACLVGEGARGLDRRGNEGRLHPAGRGHHAAVGGKGGPG